MLDSTQSSDGVITKPSSQSVAQTIDGLRRLIADVDDHEIPAGSAVAIT
jgi:hypothetical protein